MNTRQRVGDAILGLLPYLFGIFVVAGIVHIVSIFAMPRLATRDAFTRVAALVPLDRTTLLPAQARDALPNEDPATVLGVCRYDLARGPIHLTGTMAPDALMLFSFHSRFGAVYYSMTDRGASRGRLDVLVLTAAQLDDVEAQDAPDELPQELRIVAPSREGFVLFRALAEQDGDVADARKRVSSIGCALDRVPRS
jgi:uncharacterized membrane protein